MGIFCRILKEERNYILQMIKKIRASGANVLLIQKSILRDAVTDLSLHYLVMLGLLSRLGIAKMESLFSMQSPLQQDLGSKFMPDPKALLDLYCI